MPPAFNLSQDQTLQFNLCFVALRRLSAFLQSANIVSFFESFVFPKEDRLRRTTADAHTYRFVEFELLKNFAVSNSVEEELYQNRFFLSRVIRKFLEEISYPLINSKTPDSVRNRGF